MTFIYADSKVFLISKQGLELFFIIYTSISKKNEENRQYVHKKKQSMTMKESDGYTQKTTNSRVISYPKNKKKTNKKKQKRIDINQISAAD